jgi:uncharacterized protein (TIGR02757 family)
MTRAKASPDLRTFLDKKVVEYNRPSFIVDDPISIPHQYHQRQDIEIAGFFTAIFSWGNRTTIIKKTRELMQLMDGAPYQFILQHQEADLKKFLDFRHRTFNATDLLYFIAFFRHHYSHHTSLEDAFLRPWEDRPRAAAKASGAAADPLEADWQAERSLSAFYHYFFSLDGAFAEDPKQKIGPRRKPANDWPSAGGLPVLVPPRTRKHIASPEKHSSCKRINMFLRWMVRHDNNGVDFGLWPRIPMAALICPLDLHVARVAKKFGLLTRKPSDWQAATELTAQLRLLDPTDPTKYDFALFGLGVIEKF